MTFIDTHCHLDFPAFDPDRDEVISKAQKESVSHIINIGSSLKSSQASLDLAARYDFIYASVGIHPHEADNFSNADALRIREMARNDKVVAIGEIGLDYYKNYSRQENQRPLFSSLLGLARVLDLPLVIHSRQAQLDTLKMLKEAMPVRAVVHCFSGDASFLESCLALGFYISFTCNITYEKAQELRQLVKITPLDRIMLETDAPYLPAEGFRGKRNGPWAVKIVAEKIAQIKGLDIDKVASVTTQNAKAFFKIS